MSRWVRRRVRRRLRRERWGRGARCVRRMLWVVAVYLLTLACLLLLVGGVYELVGRVFCELGGSQVMPDVCDGTCNTAPPGACAGGNMGGVA